MNNAEASWTVLFSDDNLDDQALHARTEKMTSIVKDDAIGTMTRTVTLGSDKDCWSDLITGRMQDAFCRFFVGHLMFSSGGR
jgi:hypothetical protein